MDTAVIISGFQQAFAPVSLLMMVAGVLWGTIIGAIPGLGGIIAVSTLIPFTYNLPSSAALGLLMGVFCGVMTGGALCSILLNTPGTPQAAATCFDGFPMAKQGRGDEAVGWSTVASVIGGLFSCVILIFVGPLLAEYSRYVGPAETLALLLMSLTCIAGVSPGGMAKGFMMGCIGLFAGTIGVDPMSGNQRFTFHIFELQGGIDMIAFFVGVFAMTEIFCRAFNADETAKIPIKYTGMKLPGRKDWNGRLGTLLKSCLIGTGVGIMPGIGADTAAFISYAEAKRNSPFKDGIGKGEPAGIIAPEAANNAVTGGALIPSLALGIPGDPLVAVMMGALVIHGLTPGVRLMRDNPDVVVSLFILLILANLLMLPAAMLVGKAFSRFIRLPEPLLMPIVGLLCVLGVYVATNSAFSLQVTLFFAVFGFLSRLFGLPIAPLAIGFMLSVKLEVSLRQALLLTDNDPLFLLKSPIAVILFTLTALIPLWPVLKKVKASVRHG